MKKKTLPICLCLNLTNFWIKGPKMVEFGRRPAWNCPKEDADSNVNNNTDDEEKFDSSFDEKFDKEVSHNPLPVEQKSRPAIKPRQRMPPPPTTTTTTTKPRPLVDMTPPPPSFVTSGPSPSSPSLMFSASTSSDLSMYLSPPTQPEMKSGGFVPNLVDQTSGPW